MKKRPKTSSSGSKPGVAFLKSPKFQNDTPTLSQDPYADKVVWDENNLLIPTIDGLEDDDYGYNADQSSSLFSWIEKEKEKQQLTKKRKIQDISNTLLMPSLDDAGVQRILPDEDSNLTLTLDMKENIQNFSQNSQGDETADFMKKATHHTNPDNNHTNTKIAPTQPLQILQQLLPPPLPSYLSHTTLQVHPSSNFLYSQETVQYNNMITNNCQNHIAVTAKPAVNHQPDSLDFDFELTEEDLKRIDEEVHQKISETQTNIIASASSMPPPFRLTNEPSLLSNIAMGSESHHLEGDIIASKEDLDFFEELERQAIFNMTQQQHQQNKQQHQSQSFQPQSHHQYHHPYINSTSPPPSSSFSRPPLPPPSYHNTSNNSYQHAHQTNLATIQQAFPSDAIPCLRLRVKSISSDPMNRRKIITATPIAQDTQTKQTKPTETLASSSSTAIIQIHLLDDWYNVILKENDVFHVIDFAMDSAAPSTTTPFSSSSSSSQHRSIFKPSAPPLILLEISNQQGLLISHPDILVSPTKIAESCTCLRRGVLNDKIRNFGISAPSAIMGNVRHHFIEALTERVLQELSSSMISAPITHEQQLQQRIKPEEVSKMMREAIAEHVEELYSIHMSDSEVQKDLQSLIPAVFYWLFLAHRQGIHALTATLPVHPGSSLPPIPAEDASLREICGVEESIHSPVLGIKGQVDMIGKGRLLLHQKKNLPQSSLLPVSELLLPIELKTGKWRSSSSIAHRAQVILYLLLMNLRQQSSANIRQTTSKQHHNITNNNNLQSSDNSVSNSSKYGLLVYLHENELKVDFISPNWDEIRSLMIARNALAQAISAATYKAILLNNADSNTYNNNSNNQQVKLQLRESLPKLPPMLKASSFECTYCYAASECMMYRSVWEEEFGVEGVAGGANEVNSGIFHYVMKGIQSRHLQYFKHWDRLIDLESLGQQPSQYRIGNSRRVMLGEDGKAITSTANRSEENENEFDSMVVGDGGWWSRAAALLEKEGRKAIGLLSLSSSDISSNHNKSNNSERNLVKDDNAATTSKIKTIIHFKRARLSSPQLVRLFAKEEMRVVVEDVMRRDMSLSSLVTGDRVFISVERILPTTTSSSDAIEALQTASRALMSIDANICSATVVQLSSDEVQLSLSLGERALTSLLAEVAGGNGINGGGLSLLADSGWFFRLDKDESNLSISTMRANLMELFTEPFSPKLYLDTMNAGKKNHFNKNNNANSTMTRSSSLPTNNNNNNNNNTTLARSNTVQANSNSNNNSNTTNTANTSNSDHVAQRLYYNTFYRQKLRELIVDYREPTFQPHNTTDPNNVYSFLFIPKHMPHSQYYATLQFLNYALQYEQDHQLLERYPLKEDIVHTFQPKQNNHQPQQQQQAVKIIYKQDGRIILPGGLILYPGCHPSSLYREYQQLHPEQQKILLRILSMNDYLLLRGLPGTGKTTLLCLIIRIIIARNETVLMTSYTHNAINHLLNKLLNKGMRSLQILRIGNSSAAAISEEVEGGGTVSEGRRVDTIQSCTLEASSSSSTTAMTVAALTERVSSTRLFMTTILNASRNKLLKSCKVNYCMIDEAGQITQPLTIGGLLHAEKFLLVGDECQLSPLIINKQAMKMGMNVSLLQQLMEIHPMAVETLSVQYRMNEMIMSITNQLIYQQRMTCGSREVSQATLLLDGSDKMLWLPKERASSNGGVVNVGRGDWLYQTLLPSNAVVFLNTDHLISTLITTETTSTTTAFSQSRDKSNNYEVKIHRTAATPATASNDLRLLSSTVIASPVSIILQQSSTRRNTAKTRNVVEACIIEHILKAFDVVQSSSSTSSKYHLTILTPYRSQVQLLQQLIAEIQSEVQEQARLLFDDLSAQDLPIFPSTVTCEVCTIDKYQGKDADIVILSLVLLPDPNPSSSSKLKKDDVMNVGYAIPVTVGKEGGKIIEEEDDASNILKDWKRINVALTRAKLKLIVIGSYKMMQENSILKQVADYLSQRNWMVSLPVNSLQLYPVQLSSWKYLPYLFTQHSNAPPMTTQLSKRSNSMMQSEF